MKKINGGVRPGSGRKASFAGEKTKPVRIPESQIPLILSFLEAYRQRESDDDSVLTFAERFAYELEIWRLKGGLSKAIDFLQNSFRPIPVISKKINSLQTILDKPRNFSLAKPVPVQPWITETYSPAGAPWQLSSEFKNQKIVFISKPPVPLPSSNKVTDTHQYKLSVEEVDNLIEFLLDARSFLSK